MESSPLLQRYRSDRRKLLEFLLSTGLVRAPALASLDSAGVDLDNVSADYVLECIQSGGDFDPSEASNRFSASLNYPIMVNSSTGNIYFLLSRPELSRSPPVRNAPQVGIKASTSNPSSSADQMDDFVSRGIRKCLIENIADASSLNLPCQSSQNAKSSSLGLPTMSTGLSDDDIQQTAYEVLLASFILSGRQEDIFQCKKNGKGSKILSPQGTAGNELSPIKEDCNFALMEVIRVQLEVSEAIGIVANKGLRNFCLKMMHEQNDVPHISLHLLNVISSFDFPSERSYMRWLRRQANVLEEFLLHSTSFLSDASMEQTKLVSRLRSIEEWASTDGCTETLKALKNWASELSSMPKKFGIPHETYYWTWAYHFNIKLYERLLYSVFDVLDDGELLQEAEEILAVVRLTWPILGVTEKMHAALFAWVLFLQFIQTGELKLLKLTLVELHKALSCQDDDAIELYTSSLSCSVLADGGTRVLKLVDSVLFNIKIWSCNQLKDYHLHFDKDTSTTFENVVALAVLSGSHFPDECAEIKHTSPLAENLAASKLIHMFVEKSIEAAYRQVLKFLDAESLEKDCSLAMLANKLKAIAEKEFTREQLDTLEDTIKNSWTLLQKGTNQIFNVVKDVLPAPTSAVDELFTTFDDIRRSAIYASDLIVEFIGARTIFWDLRDSFIFTLYQGNVQNARFEIFIPLLDEVLDRVCDLIVDTLRDQVVSSIFQSTMDGFIWVILDGGPSRVFSQNDAIMMQEDLNLLKDLFIANGQGLPRDVVEKEARLGEEILDLYAMKADIIIDMLMSASQQISENLKTMKSRRRSATDADTLLRILCHKKDKVASNFLKIQYQLPKSSDYEDTFAKAPHDKSPLRRKSSFNWNKNGQRSFRILKTKLQEATSEIRHAP
ncbi:hypothetical protein Cni_G18786 [Canna indica]|uniref:MHD2 domain-containing protein n=1 Tax=Canna indica TaxID=4628 RepID=A0AAQ3KJV7_9LILI|nr:hypothetical protein Cni_G18786 [Canna indica]